MSNPEEMRRKLEALENEVNNNQPPLYNPQKMSSNPKANPLKPLLDSFDRLPTVFKVGAIAVGIVLSLSILSMVLKLVMSVVVVAALAIGGYVVYKMFLEETN